MSVELIASMGSILNSLTDFVKFGVDAYVENKIAKDNREFQSRIEENRLRFEKFKLEESYEMQKELIKEQSRWDLEQQQVNFQLQCGTEEWKYLLSEWPLITPPMVIRKRAVLQSGAVCFQVFYTHSHDELLFKYVYPVIEQGLKDFTDLYANKYSIYNLIFHQNCFKGEYNGNASNENLYFVLENLPVLIIDTNVAGSYIHVSLTMWGVGTTEKRQITLQTIPFERNLVDAGQQEECCGDLAGLLLTYLKFAIGYSFDLYNLIENAAFPMFPKIMEMYDENYIMEELSDIIGSKYMDMYRLILKNSNLLVFKSAAVHLLRLEFAKSLQNYIRQEEFAECLYDSLCAWTRLRVVNTPEVFLKNLQYDNELIEQYFTDGDIRYFEELAQCFDQVIYTNNYFEIKYLVIYISKVASGKGWSFDVPNTMDTFDESDQEVLKEKDNQEYLTRKAKEGMQSGNYEQAIWCLRRNADICHKQQKEDDAYLLEHQAFLCEQQKIYRDTHISISAFIKMPYVEEMKKILTRAADEALEKEEYDHFVYYNLLNARLCRAQGKERDAFLLENSAYKYGKQAQSIQQRKGIPCDKMEKQYMLNLAEMLIR